MINRIIINKLIILIFIEILLIGNTKSQSVADSFPVIKINNYNILYGDKKNRIEINCNDTSTLKNIRIVSGYGLLKQLNERVYELTFPYYEQLVLISAYYIDTVNNIKNVISERTYEVLSSKEIRAFVGTPESISRKCISFNEIINNKTLLVFMNDTILNDIKISSFCLMYFNKDEMLFKERYNRMCVTGNVFTSESLEFLYGLDNWQKLYIDSIQVVDTENNNFFLPPIVILNTYSNQSSPDW